jgi:anti-sigma regulatory factor (Ser/Thr protein kinase)
MAADRAPNRTERDAARRFESSARERAAIPRSRHLFIAHLRGSGCDDTEDAAVVFSELVTNAVIHGGGAVRITATVNDQTIRIDVDDNHPSNPHLRAPGSGPGGLGLHIVNQLSTQWGFQPTPTGKRVWAVLPCSS